MVPVKRVRQRDRILLSVKGQVTVPVAALRRAGLKPGDKLRVESAGTGRIVLTRIEETIATYAGRLTGIYTKGSLQTLRVRVA